MSENTDHSPAPQNTIRSQTAEDLPESFRELLAKVRGRAKATVDWCRDNRDELPAGVEVLQAKEGLWQIILKASETTGDDSEPDIIVQKDEVIATMPQMSQVNGHTEVSIVTQKLGELSGTYRANRIDFLDNGLARNNTSFEEEVEKGGLYHFVPLEPYSGAPATEADIKQVHSDLVRACELVGLPEDLAS